MNSIIAAFKHPLVCLCHKKKSIFIAFMAFSALVLLIFIAGKTYQKWDQDPNRGAIAIEDGAFGESYSTPAYLDQGWDENDSLWFYNITQGSGLLPYDFYLNLEMADSKELVRSNTVMDKYRYLPQKPTFFNPNGLAVGFTKDTYKGKDYVGYTCAACHTGQVNYKGKAIRIDGAPAMADMVGYLNVLEEGLKQTISNSEKNKRFVDAVLKADNNYQSAEDVASDLKKWTDTVELYNDVNHSHIAYGYARLDAFGRIYNRVLQYVPSKVQIFDKLTQITSKDTDEYIISSAEADKVLHGVNETIIGNDQFSLILNRLKSTEAGYPGLNKSELLQVRDSIFNEPSAPVSYPFLWDIAQSDYVQWNGIANNSGVGPMGRNAGEVIGVFGILDWEARDPGFSISSLLTGQKHKKKIVDFKSSIDLVNLERIENHLASLQSPQWPEKILGKIDEDKKQRGRKIYGRYCQSCHELVDRSDADRIVISKFSAIEKIGTDPAMAKHSVEYTGKSGNFKHTYQSTDVGDVVLEEEAPVAQILTSVTKGVVATPDADKIFIRRWADWVYTLSSSFYTNPIKKDSVKAGNYNPDTTASPYSSLLSYKARSLNGIWATAPYLHNGSVPTIYDLLLPAKKAGDPEDGEYRPETFMVGSREFNPEKIGFVSEGYNGTEFTTVKVGNLNGGHEYAAGNTAQLNGETLPALTKAERLDLVEFIKSL